MFGFGDELIIQSHRIPWLIWIQILITFLLTLAILLSFFGFSAHDSSSSPTSNSLSSASCCCLGPSSTCSPRTQEPIPKEREQVARNHEAFVEITTSAGSNRRRIGVENNSETDGSSVEDLTPKPISERLHHPCRFLDIAKEAFLKCLGLGSSSRDSPPREQTHED